MCMSSGATIFQSIESRKENNAAAIPEFFCSTIKVYTATSTYDFTEASARVKVNQPGLATVEVKEGDKLVEYTFTGTFTLVEMKIYHTKAN